MSYASAQEVPESGTALELSCFAESNKATLKQLAEPHIYS